MAFTLESFTDAMSVPSVVCAHVPWNGGCCYIRVAAVRLLLQSSVRGLLPIGGAGLVRPGDGVQDAEKRCMG